MPFVPVPPTIPPLVLESLFAVCSNAMTDLNDDSENDVETVLGSILSEI